MDLGEININERGGIAICKTVCVVIDLGLGGHLCQLCLHHPLLTSIVTLLHPPYSSLARKEPLFTNLEMNVRADG